MIVDANIFLADLLHHQIFANKLVDDNRIDDPLFTFDVPMSGRRSAITCSFLSPDFVFYFQLIVVRRENPDILLYASPTQNGIISPLIMIALSA